MGGFSSPASYVCSASHATPSFSEKPAQPLSLLRELRQNVPRERLNWHVEPSCWVKALDDSVREYVRFLVEIARCPLYHRSHSLAFMYDANSVSTAEEGKRVDINLFREAPLPRLSVMDGTTSTRLSSESGSSPNRNLSATMIARASSAEMINEGRSSLSKSQGKSSLLISIENQRDSHGDRFPFSSFGRNHPPIPVRAELACAFARGLQSADVILVPE